MIKGHREKKDITSEGSSDSGFFLVAAGLLDGAGAGLGRGVEVLFFEGLAAEVDLEVEVEDVKGFADWRDGGLGSLGSFFFERKRPPRKPPPEEEGVAGVAELEAAAVREDAL